MTNLLALADEVILAGEKATEGPWQQQHQYDLDGQLTIIGAVDGPDDGRFTFTTICDVDEAPDECFSNAHFIALSRTAAPKLAQAYKEARDVIRSNLEIMEVMRELCDLQGMLIQVALYTRMEAARAFLKGE